MNVDVLTFPNDFTMLDHLLFRRYRREVPGLEEQVLAENYGLAALCPFPPRGTVVRVTPPAPPSSTAIRTIVRLFD